MMEEKIKDLEKRVVFLETIHSYAFGIILVGASMYLISKMYAK